MPSCRVFHSPANGFLKCSQPSTPCGNQNINRKGDKDNKWVMLEEEETLFSKYPEVLRLHGDDSNITELMIQAEMGQKDRYLIYGYLFIVKGEKFSPWLKLEALL